MWRSGQHCIYCGADRRCWWNDISCLEPTGYYTMQIEVKILPSLGNFPFIEPGASIEDDLEGLRGSSDGDGAVVLSVHVVGERLGLETCSLVTPSSRLILQSVRILESTNLPLSKWKEVSTSLKWVLALLCLIRGILTTSGSGKGLGSS